MRSFWLLISRINLLYEQLVVLVFIVYGVKIREKNVLFATKIPYNMQGIFIIFTPSEKP